MKYISIILMSLFLVGNAYSQLLSSTVFREGKVILQDTKLGLGALIEYKDQLFYCFASVQAVECYMPFNKGVEAKQVD